MKLTWRMLRFATFFASTFLSISALAQPNGCGTGWSQFVVPDRIALLQCEFGNSCNKHDECYAVCEGKTDGKCEYQRCKKGGDLFKKALCNTDKKLIQSAFDARDRRMTCDVMLYSDIVRGNAGRWACQALAIVYREAVKEWGDPAFKGAGQILATLAFKQPQIEYNQAISNFLNSATDEQLQKFVEADAKKAPLVSFCRRLKFIPEAGLTNFPEDKNVPCAK